MHQQDDSAPTDLVTVFYDGGCPLCSREIRHYQKLRGSDSVLWVDIQQDSAILEASGIEYTSAMEQLHVLDRQGVPQIGARGFIEIWMALPAYRWQALVIRNLRLVGPMDWFYRVFARWRLKQRQRDCRGDACTTRSNH